MILLTYLYFVVSFLQWKGSFFIYHITEDLCLITYHSAMKNWGVKFEKSGLEPKTEKSGFGGENIGRLFMLISQNSYS